MCSSRGSQRSSPGALLHPMSHCEDGAPVLVRAACCSLTAPGSRFNLSTFSMAPRKRYARCAPGRTSRRGRGVGCGGRGASAGGSQPWQATCFVGDEVAGVGGVAALVELAVAPPRPSPCASPFERRAPARVRRLPPGRSEPAAATAASVFNSKCGSPALPNTS